MNISGEDRAVMARADGALMKLHPFHQVVKSADKLVKQGVDVYQQFRCASCCAKQTMDVRNTLYEFGVCEECHHVTDIKASGCNFMALASSSGAQSALQNHILGKDSGGD